MARTSSLPLVPGPLVCIAKEWPQDVLLEEPEPNIQVVGNDMGLVLNHIPDKSVPNTIISCSYRRISREVSMQVLPLHISRTECHKYRRHTGRQKAGLRLEARPSISPEWACAGQRGTLPHNLRKERLVRLEGLRQLFTGEILQVRCFRNIKPSRIVGLPTHEEVEYQKPPARMSPESPIVVTHHMAGIVVQIDLPLSGGIKISPARRIEGWEGHRKDPLSSGRFIEGG
jgi:hypothetical protein